MQIAQVETAQVETAQVETAQVELEQVSFSFSSTSIGVEGEVEVVASFVSMAMLLFSIGFAIS
jgi:hypothetical protein